MAAFPPALLFYCITPDDVSDEALARAAQLVAQMLMVAEPLPSRGSRPLDPQLDRRSPK
jgi:hypothetical protein